MQEMDALLEELANMDTATRRQPEDGGASPTVTRNSSSERQQKQRQQQEEEDAEQLAYKDGQPSMVDSRCDSCLDKHRLRSVSI